MQWNRVRSLNNGDIAFLIWVHYYYCYWRPSVCVIPHTACIIFVSSYYRVSFYVYRCTPTAKSYLTTEYFVLLYLQIV